MLVVDFVNVDLHEHFVPARLVCPTCRGHDHYRTLRVLALWGTESSDGGISGEGKLSYGIADRLYCVFTSENRGDVQEAALAKQASPVAWQHINLYGRYEFRKPPEPLNVDEIVRELAEIRIGTEAALAP